MRNINLLRCRISLPRGFAALSALLLTQLGGVALPSEALARTGHPLAYVAASPDNVTFNSIVVIDTGDNAVVDTVQVGQGPYGLAVAPDGKHVYVTNYSDATVSVIETLREKDSVVATVQLDGNPLAAAISPDGKTVYVGISATKFGSSAYVTMIDTATNAVVGAPILAGYFPTDIASIVVSPDGKYVYAATSGPRDDNPVLVIDTTTNTIAGSNLSCIVCIVTGVTPDGKNLYVIEDEARSIIVVNAETSPYTIFQPFTYPYYPSNAAVTPNGKYLYVLGASEIDTTIPTTLEVFDTATDTAVGEPIMLGTGTGGLAFTPDGRHLYVSNSISNTVSMIDTTTNTLVYKIAGIYSPAAVAIVPAPQGVLFSAFNAKLDVRLQPAARDGFELSAGFTLGSSSNGILPAIEPVRLQAGPFITTIPAGSFEGCGEGSWAYDGVIDGVRIDARIKSTGALRYSFEAVVQGANLTGISNPVQVSMSIGDDAGLTDVAARFHKDHREAWHDQAPPDFPLWTVWDRRGVSSY